jgi:hypothetical protein
MSSRRSQRASGRAGERGGNSKQKYDKKNQITNYFFVFTMINASGFMNESTIGAPLAIVQSPSLWQLRGIGWVYALRAATAEQHGARRRFCDWRSRRRMEGLSQCSNRAIACCWRASAADRF